MPLFSFFISALPDIPDLISFSFVAISFVFYLFAGRVVTKGKHSVEFEILAGWGLACLIFTFFGVAHIKLYYAYFIFIPVVIYGFINFPLIKDDLIALSRIFIVSLPLLILIIGTDLWQSDTWSFWLPNYYYIEEFHAFPEQGKFPEISFFYGFPYNLQLAGYIASPFYELPKAMLHFNIILSILFALFIARVISTKRILSLPEKAPGWIACLGGIGFTTLFNPGFVPSIVFSSYGDFSTSFLLAVSSFYLLRFIIDKKNPINNPVALGLILAALANIKQANIILVVIVIFLAAITCILRKRNLKLVIISSVIPAAIYALWRFYIYAYLPESENKLMSFAEWDFSKIPEILASIFDVIIRKGGLFGLFTIIIVYALWPEKKRENKILFLFTGGIILLYNLFIITIYVGHFSGTTALSYWRYSTHIAPLALVTVLPFVRKFFSKIRLGKKLLPALFIIYVAAVLLLIGHIRYDLAPRKIFIRNNAAEIAGLLGKKKDMGIVTYGDNRLDDYLSYRGILLYHRRDLNINYSPQTFEEVINDKKYSILLLTCKPAELFSRTRPNSVVLLKRAGRDWKFIKSWKPPKEMCVSK